jgi:hypothetical protein
VNKIRCGQEGQRIRWRDPTNSFEKRHIFLRKLMNGDAELTSRDIKRRCVFTEGMTLDNKSRDFVKEAVLEDSSEHFRERNSEDGRVVWTMVPSKRGLEQAVRYVRKGLQEEFIRHFYGKEIRIYCGLSTMFVPEVYDFVLNKVFANKRYCANVNRYEDILGRLASMKEFSYRIFTQLKELQDGEKGSRRVNITKEEYKNRMLEMEYEIPVVKSLSKCIICNKRYDKENKGDMSIHHIVGRGAFRHIEKLFVEQQYFDAKQRSRGVANFGSNQVWMCRKCHDGIEDSINHHVLVQNPDSNIGKLYVSDLFIILARKIAHYLVVDTKTPNLYLYYDTMMIEGVFFVDAYLNQQILQKDHHP